MELPTLEEWFTINSTYDERRQKLPPQKQKGFDAWVGHFDFHHLFTAHLEPETRSYDHWYEGYEEIECWDEFEELVNSFYHKRKTQRECVVDDGKLVYRRYGQDVQQIGKEQGDGYQQKFEDEAKGEDEGEDRFENEEQNEDEIEEVVEDLGEEEEQEGATISTQSTPEGDMNGTLSLKRKEHPENSEQSGRPRRIGGPFWCVKPPSPAPPWF
ncbi:hypothetical protein BKA65DRAFT_284920 [Rhexocercosporidium sp. MPI-PUGE-AT-0058]|nr:hypothetical protein BKA65DRAFT_284920 [Rhexocercosporidium sp. MPI-PUGE-AT-0058]